VVQEEFVEIKYEDNWNMFNRCYNEEFIGRNLMLVKSNQRTEVNMINSIILFLWGIFIILRPFYFFKKSGIPQIADYVMVVIIVLVFISSGLKLKKEIYPNVKNFIYFVSYIIFINFIWTFIIDDTSILRSSLFYFYNFLVFTAFLVTYSKVKEKLIIVMSYSIFVTIIVQTVLSFFYLEIFSGFRKTLFFNNPNQLGYFAVLCTVIFFIISQDIKIKDIYQVLFYLSTMYLVVLSLSQAAIIGFVIFLVYLLKKHFIILLFISILLIVIYPVVDGEMKLLSNFEIRMRDLGHGSDDTLTGRGYDRIVNHPQYLLFGAGEGSNKRFESILPGELHSGVGSIFFSYGLVGFILFLKVLYGLFKPLHKNCSYVLYTLPVFIISLAHQSFRWPLFWMLMAIVFILHRNKVDSQPVLPEKTKDKG